MLGSIFWQDLNDGITTNTNIDNRVRFNMVVSIYFPINIQFCLPSVVICWPLKDSYAGYQNKKSLVYLTGRKYCHQMKWAHRDDLSLCVNQGLLITCNSFSKVVGAVQNRAKDCGIAPVRCFCFVALESAGAMLWNVGKRRVMVIHIFLISWGCSKIGNTVNVDKT